MHTDSIQRSRRLAICISLALGGTATAQDQPSQPSAGRIEEVVVTARRVEESLQETPIAITAFTGDALIDRQVFSTDKLTEVVPNLQFGTNAPLAGNNNSSQVFIRGIGQTDPTSTVDPGVGLYIDDIYIGTAVGARMGLRDIASVQVLRGPQGTLFGRNTIGGAILLTTTEPGEEFGGTVRAGFGSDSLVDGFLALDAPFTDTFRSRFTFGMRQQDGYVKRPDGTDLGDTDTFTGTAKFAWTPNDRFRGKLMFDYSTADENGSPLVFAEINEAATFPRVASFDAGCPGTGPAWNSVPEVPMIDDPRCANDFQGAGPYRNNGSLPLESTLDVWGAALNLAYELSDASTLKWISSYRDIEWTGIRDADNTPLTILHTDQDVVASQWSQELQYTYQSDPLTGVVGLYYFAQESDDVVTVQLNPPPPGVQQDSDNNEVDNDSWAVFTQWTYDFSERLSLTAGGRYTEETKRSYPDQFDYANPDVKQVPVMWYEDTFSDFTPSASITYRWTPKAMTYLSYSEGFKGGGWNSHFNAPLTPESQAALHEFKPEQAETIEAGFKLDLVDNTLRLNGAVFTSDYTDMQVTYRGPCQPPAPCGVAPFILNAGEASIDGAELEATWVPTDALTIEASVGYLDATIDSLENIEEAILPPGLEEGNTLPFAPELQAHLGIAYAARVRTLEVTPRVDVSYQDTTYFDAVNTPEIAQVDTVTRVNASVTVAPAAGRWRLVLGVNNATDEVYPIAGNSSLSTGSGYAEIAYSRPREYYATATFDF